MAPLKEYVMYYIGVWSGEISVGRNGFGFGIQRLILLLLRKARASKDSGSGTYTFRIFTSAEMMMMPYYSISIPGIFGYTYYIHVD
jgi:hypothetical protein